MTCYCGKRFKIPEELAGKKGRCPACGGTILLLGENAIAQTPRSEATGKVEPPPANLGATTDAPGNAQVQTRHGGIGRLVFWMGQTGITLLAVGVRMLDKAGVGPLFLLPAALICLVASFMLTNKRYENIGMRRWWTWLWGVPIAHLFVGYHCIVYPEGYADTRKLDSAGYIMRLWYGVPVFLIVLPIEVLIIADLLVGVKLV